MVEFKDYGWARDFGLLILLMAALASLEFKGDQEKINWGRGVAAASIMIIANEDIISSSEYSS